MRDTPQVSSYAHAIMHKQIHNAEAKSGDQRHSKTHTNKWTLGYAHAFENRSKYRERGNQRQRQGQRRKKIGGVRQGTAAPGRFHANRSHANRTASDAARAQGGARRGPVHPDLLQDLPRLHPVTPRAQLIHTPPPPFGSPSCARARRRPRTNPLAAGPVLHACLCPPSRSSPRRTAVNRRAAAAAADSAAQPRLRAARGLTTRGRGDASGRDDPPRRPAGRGAPGWPVHASPPALCRWTRPSCRQASPALISDHDYRD